MPEFDRAEEMVKSLQGDLDAERRVSRMALDDALVTTKVWGLIGGGRNTPENEFSQHVISPITFSHIKNELIAPHYLNWLKIVVYQSFVPLRFCLLSLLATQ